MDPVVVIGAGPQGLAAATHLLERGLEPLVLESGPAPAAAVAEWGHVRLFSTWSELTDAPGRRLLERSGRSVPTSGYPTGAQWIQEYLSPVAVALGDRVRSGARVVGVGRAGRDLSIDEGRAEQPFVVHVEQADGTEDRISARTVIDASGTWRSPAPLGADGLPALGERSAVASGVLSRRIPTDEEAEDLAGRHVVVVGSGHSATTAIGTLAAIARRDQGTRITWVLRRGAVGSTFGGGEADALPERGALGRRAKAAVDEGLVDMVTGFRVDQVLGARADGEVGGDTTDRAVLVSADGRRLEPADRVLVLTGFRPDLSFLSELRLDLDARLQAPVRLATEVDPNLHSCGSVRATGARDLAHPEPGFYIVGAKSYGRAPTFLALTGYEQVRSVVAEIAGDHEASARIELALPQTGVCGGSGLFDAPDATEVGGSCCSPSPASGPQPITLGIR